MGVLALTNNMITFTFFKAKSPCLSHFSKMLLGICCKDIGSLGRKCCIMVVIRLKN